MFSKIGMGIGYLLCLTGVMFVSKSIHAADNLHKLILFLVLGGLFEIGGIFLILRGLSKLRGVQLTTRTEGDWDV